jgi:hypothetical protein
LNKRYFFIAVPNNSNPDKSLISRQIDSLGIIGILKDTIIGGTGEWEVWWVLERTGQWQYINYIYSSFTFERITIYINYFLKE